ncbi:MAG: S-layer homology domain-containing protein, partial [Oscillospiraceae bacterium]|nr:S-layer homology domain-containing protein [Oscillospiraceae bacterium]
MQNKTKKFISAFLTLAMMLGLFWAMPMTASTEGEICQIGSIKYSKFADALISVPEGGSTPTVIKLLDNIKIEQEYGAYIISNQKITFDLNGYDLIFASTLHVEKKSIIDYIGTGNFKVIVNTTLNSDYSNKVALEVIESSMKLTGVEIRDNGTGNYAMVVALACDGSSSYPGSVVVNGDVKAVGNGKETSYGIGVSAQGGAVTVTGNIINENIKSDTTGVEVILGGTVTVNGDIGAHPSKYVSFNNTYKTKEDFTTPTTKAGYKTYTDGTNTVWVKEDADLPILIIPPIYDFKFIAIINLQPEDSQIMEGENTSFHIDAFGAGYQWQYRLNIAGAAWLDLSNKGVYSDVTTDTLILTEVPLIYNGYQYRCVVHGFSADSVIESESAKLTVTAAPATEPTTPEDPKPFPMTDLSPTDWFYNNVKTAWEMGLVNGKTPTTYEPTANLTYAEA